MPKNKILIAIDEPNWASVIVQTLFNVVNKEDMEIILLNVLETSIVDENYFYSFPEKYIKHEARKANFAYVEELLKKNNFEYQFIFKEGDAAENIVKISKELDTSLIVVGSHNKKIFETLFLGSVSYKVSRLAKCSVMIISSKYHVHNVRKKEFNILFAVDRSGFSKYAAEKLPGLIDIERAKIDLLNVIIPPQKVIPPEAYIYTDIGKIIDESKHVSGETLDEIAEILEKKGISKIKKVSKIDDPASSIINYAEQNSIDLIVIGPHGRKDLSSLFLGGTSMKVAEKSEIPILLVKK